jgi:hypothetical protein
MLLSKRSSNGNMGSKAPSPSPTAAPGLIPPPPAFESNTACPSEELDPAGTSNSMNVRPDRGRNPRCFNGLPYRCEFPQVKIVCQQIRGHSFHNFAVAKSLTQSLSWAAWHSKRQRTPHHTPRGPRPSVTRRHRLALQTIENRVRPSERYWSVYELTHRAPGSRRAAGSRSTRTECPKSVGTLLLSVGTHSGTASH